MTILCKKCGARFESLIVDRELALREISNKALIHAQKKHQSDFEPLRLAVGKIQIIIAEFMGLSEFVVVPEDETYILDKLENMQDVIMASLGFDPNDEEDDEEDEEEEVEPILEPDTIIIEEERNV